MISLTIITVVYNDFESLNRTINSIRNLDFNDIQYIIIDGGSQDGTLDVIHANIDIIDKYISEPDHGIYDAMNKGLKFAQGEYIHYLNAGDLVLSNAYKQIFCTSDMEECDVLYGDLLVQGSDLTYISRPLDSIFFEMPIFHPAIFVKRNVLDQFPFDRNYKIAGDYDLILRLYLAGKKFKYYPIFITSFNLAGISNTQFLRAIYETAKSIYRHVQGMRKWHALVIYSRGKLQFLMFSLLAYLVGINNYQKVRNYFRQILPLL